MLKNLVLLICPFLLVLCCCTSERHQARHAQLNQWMESNGKIKVLSTTAMINDLVEQIGKEHIDTLTLIQGELDPHSYQLVKGDDEKLSFADLIFFNGLELEHGPSLHRYLTGNEKAIPLGDMVDLEHPGAVINSQGQKDPHIWMDVSIWSKTIPFIVKALSHLDPLHAEHYSANGHLLREKMNKMHVEILKIMHQVPSSKRYLVTSHDAFHYFARAYLVEPGELESGEWVRRFAAPEGLAPESQLSVGDIRAIIDHLKDYQIHVLFPESNVSKDSIRKIVDAGREQGLELEIACCPLFGDAMGHPGSEGDTYLKMLHYNARTLASHMDKPKGADWVHTEVVHLEEDSEDDG